MKRMQGAVAVLAAALLLGIAGCHPAGIDGVAGIDGTEGGLAVPGGGPIGEVPVVEGDPLPVDAPPAEGGEAAAPPEEAPEAGEVAPSTDASPQNGVVGGSVTISPKRNDLGECVISFLAETCDYEITATGGHGTYDWEIVGDPAEARIEQLESSAKVLLRVFSSMPHDATFTLVARDPESPRNNDRQEYRVQFVAP